MPKFDFYQQITNKIVAAVETAGPFRLPWSRCSARPVNVASKAPYNGVNVLSLWVSALNADYQSNIWGTYRQWQAAGCQVRKGEKSSQVVFYRTYTDETDESEHRVARASHVFNAAQVDGYQPPAPPTVFDPVASAEAFVRSTGAVIEEGGDRACYVPSRDMIRMPDRHRFTDREAFYATLCHELVHWSGAEKRLARDLSGRFGSDRYAVEELVAELGAAFLCADLGISQEPREDHVAYVRSWLEVLKRDMRAIFTAASKASQAAGWLTGLGVLDVAV